MSCALNALTTQKILLVLKVKPRGAARSLTFYEPDNFLLLLL